MVLERNCPKYTSHQVHLFLKTKVETTSQACHLQSVLKTRRWSLDFNYYECKKLICLLGMDRDNSVGTETYGMEGLGIKSRWRRNYSQPSRPALGRNQAPVKLVPGVFPVVKAVGAWR